MKITRYLDHVRQRPARVMIRDELIERARDNPEHEAFRADGRIRR